MADPYTDVSISSYNANPPPDDGSDSAANTATWAGVKTKLGDPLKTAFEALNTNIGAMVDKLLDGAGVTTDGSGATLTSSVQGKLVRQTASGITTITPDATSVTAPFIFAIVNDGGGDNTIDGSSSQTINGNATITLSDQQGIILFTDGSNWFAIGFPTNIQTAQIAANAVTAATIGAGVSPGLLHGLTLSNGTDATNDIDIATGTARNLADDFTIILSSALTKQLDATWAAGDNAGMRNSALDGGSIANRTYQIWLVSDGTTVDIYATAQATESGCLTALQAESGGSAYAYARRIGAIRRESGAIVPFQQYDDKFIRDTPVNDYNTASPGTSEVTPSLSTPAGIVTEAIISFTVDTGNTQTESYALVRPVAAANVAPAATRHTIFVPTSGSDNEAMTANLQIPTDTSSQIAFRLSASHQTTITTHGWIDRRNRLS